MRWKLALTLTLLLVMPGCLQGMPGAPDGAGGNGDGDGSVDDTPGTSPTFDEALGGLRGNGSDAPRFSIQSTVEVTNATGATTTTTAAVLVDASQTLAMSTLETDGADLGAGVDATTFHTVRVGSILLMGPPHALASVHNASLPPVEGLDALSPETRAPQPSGLTDPVNLLDLLNSLPPEARTGNDTVEHEGRTVHEVTLEHQAAPGHVEARLLLAPGTGHLLDVRGSTEGRVHGNGTQPETTSFHLTFRYGTDATHPHRDALLRAASLTFLTPDNLPGGDESTWTGSSRTWTIQPSNHPGLVALEEATAHVVNRTGAGTLTTHVSLPLEDREASGDGYHLTYRDHDEDGFVTPGDTLTLTREGNGTPELHLLDETTGLRLVPAPTILMVLGSTIGAVLIMGRRRPSRNEPLK